MKNIVLIGMSGVGKTEIGKSIAKKLNYAFIDIDDLIVKSKNLSIDNIFKIYGETYFRNLEADIVKSLSTSKRTVISTGGGVILRKDNIENLRKNGFIFLLMGKIENIYKNIVKSSEKRPLLQKGPKLYEDIVTLYKKREELYINSADKIVSVDDKSIDEISNEIIDFYSQHLTCSK